MSTSALWVKRDFVCSHAFDPCYGHKVYRPGDRITVQTQPEQYGESQRVVWSSCEGQSMGWGWPISPYDLTQHFVAAEVRS